MTVTAALLSFAVVAALLTITPGLDTALVLRSALVQGHRLAIATGVGIISGAFVWGVAASVGLAALLRASETAFTVLRLVGAAYMIWLGAAFAEASGAQGKDAEKAGSKPLRASLLIAVVFVHKPSFKVPAWEQEAVASGVAHTLSLLLDEAGWGVFWRTGILTRSEPVHRMHELAPNEQLLGWLYVGGLPEKTKSDKKKRLEVGRYLSELS